MSEMPVNTFEGNCYWLGDNKSAPTSCDPFYVTPSRIETVKSIESTLTMRKLRLNSDLDLLDYGKHGLVLQGPSGVGKSHIVLAYLNQQGYQQLDFNDLLPEDPTNCYYYLTPTDFGRAEEILIKAKKHAMIVVIEEFNTMALEKIANELLTGGKNQRNQPDRDVSLFLPHKILSR